jgi:MFS transporter, DHA1 family, tetracycline resistance protein
MDKRRITITFLIVLTNTIGATAILPMLPIYVEGQFHATPVQAMLVIAAFYAAQFVAAPWLGKLSDRFGRRRLLIVSQMGTIVSYLLFLFASPLGNTFGVVLGMSGGLIMIYVARLLDGLTGGNVSVAEAYASDISDDKSRAQALGLIGGANGVGHILGPALAIALSGISLLAPIVGALVVSGATLLLTILFLDETLTPEKRSARQNAEPDIPVVRLLTNRPVALVLATAFVIALYIATVFSSFSVYAERVLFADQPSEIVVQNVNFMIMMMGLAAAVSQIFLVAPLVRRVGEQALIVIGSILLLISAIGISSGSLVLVLASLLAYALGFAMSWPSLQAVMTRFSSQETMGRQLGLVQSAFSLAFILAPLAAGFLLQAIGPQAIFYNGALLMGLAIILGIIVLHLIVPGSAIRQINDGLPVDSGSLLQRFHH